MSSQICSFIARLPRRDAFYIGITVPALGSVGAFETINFVHDFVRSKHLHHVVED